MSTEKPVFTKEAEDIIFRTARSQVLWRVLWHRSGRKSPDFQKMLGELAKTDVLGTFVSFKKRGELRSCMGWMNDGITLAEALKGSADSAACEDPRFPPLRSSEFADLTMEVWVLWGMHQVHEIGESRLSAFEIGRHGLQIHYGGKRGLLLPGVAVEFKMSPRTFLEAVCQKAGLPRNAWLDPQTVLYTFEGLAINRPFYSEDVAREVTEASEKGMDETHFDLRNFGWNFGPLVVPSPPAPRRKPKEYPAVRPAAAAGMFYPRGNEQKLLLDQFEAELPPDRIQEDARAVLVPHAGWIYSGKLAFQTLANVKIPSSVFILAPKHRPEGKPWSLSPSLLWNFGTGTLPNDIELMEGIADAVPQFQIDETAHRREHAIEVLLPMIARLAPKTKVAGGVLGYGNEADLFRGADLFADYYMNLSEKPLLIISSDMNHYESEERTRILDQKALTALETLDPRNLCQTVSANGITMCGVLPAVFFLEALKKNGLLHSFRKIGYTTSGKSSGDYLHVVGYAGYTFH